MTNYKSPVLFKKRESGSGMQQWRTWSKGRFVFTEFGVVGGKLQMSSDEVSGKNTGKVNATTPEEQAAEKSKQLERKIIKRGFLPDAEAARKTSNALPAIKPMTALVYEDLKGKVTYPAFVQPKLDGVRCVAIVRDGKCTLYTRSQKVVETVPHVNEAVEDLCRRTSVTNFKLDGEFYSHSLKDNFNKILGTVKRGTESEDSSVIEYHVFDIPGEKPFNIRKDQLETIREVIATKGTQKMKQVLKIVPTVVVDDEASLYTRLKSFEDLGYEGVMYRSREGLYEGKRSKGLLKVKSFHGEGSIDEDFEVIGLNPGKGKLRGKVGSFICKTSKGIEFKAKMEGSLDALPLLLDGQRFIGRTLIVKFQNYTPDGSPRFPVALRFKDLEVEA